MGAMQDTGRTGKRSRLSLPTLYMEESNTGQKLTEIVQ